MVEAPQGVNLPAGVQCDLELDYAMVLPEVYMGTNLPGVIKLITN